MVGRSIVTLYINGLFLLSHQSGGGGGGGEDGIVEQCALYTISLIVSPKMLSTPNRHSYW